MAYSLIGTQAHEWLGIGMFVLLTTHHILNLNWWKRLNKGKYTLFRTVQTILDMLILCSVLGSMMSGIILSRHIFLFLKITSGSSWARTIHMICAYWGFMLMAVHLGFHWNMMLSMATRGIKKKSGAFTIILRVLTVLIAGYGIYAMPHRNFVDYLLLKNRFVFFDQSEPVIWFLLDYVAIMGLFVTVGHYGAKALQKKK
ncbi:MAG: DUF4405 domain-containing protein [Candidatus Gastranaerophilaceae bacterium]|nr:DUF4405 domain-containing protein [Candidatus Gastranaerophilaceae bacterium]